MITFCKDKKTQSLLLIYGIVDGGKKKSVKQYTKKYLLNIGLTIVICLSLHTKQQRDQYDRPTQRPYEWCHLIGLEDELTLKKNSSSHNKREN